MKRFFVFAVLAVLGAVAGCSGTPTGKGKTAKYALYGLAEHNLDDGKDYLYLEFTSGGKGVPGSFARLAGDTDTLFFNGQGAISASPTVSWGFNDQVAVTVHDTAAEFAHTVLVRMPNNFWITNFSPASDIYQSGNVRVEWSGSAGAAGYFVTCVQGQSGGAARGFAEAVGTTEVTFGPSAFENRLFPNQPRDTGSFHVFVVAYSPTFSPRPGPKYLDTPEFDKLEFLPSVAGTDISGAFGAAVVSARKTFEVVAQQ